MKTKALVLVAVAASLTIGTSATAFAAPNDRGRDERGAMNGHGRAAVFVRMLQELDTDKNGQISRAEANAGAEKLFAAIDTDGDGSLTPGELRKHRESMREEWRKERQSARAEREDNEGPRADRRDGDRGHRDWRAERDGPRHGWRGEDGPRREWGRRDGGHRPMAARLMQRADIDENGQISKPEALAMADRMFSRMDRNKDGVISADDFPKRPWIR